MSDHFRALTRPQRNRQTRAKILRLEVGYITVAELFSSITRKRNTHILATRILQFEMKVSVSYEHKTTANVQQELNNANKLIYYFKIKFHHKRVSYYK